MEFSNLFFLYIFLPLTLAIYFLVPQMRGKNYVLITASLIFYAMGQPYYLPLLLLTAYANYALAYRVQDGNRAMLAVAVGVEHRLHRVELLSPVCCSLSFWDSLQVLPCPSVFRSIPSSLYPIRSMSTAGKRVRRSIFPSCCCMFQCSRRW